MGEGIVGETLLEGLEAGDHGLIVAGEAADGADAVGDVDVPDEFWDSDSVIGGISVSSKLVPWIAGSLLMGADPVVGGD